MNILRIAPFKDNQIAKYNNDTLQRYQILFKRSLCMRLFSQSKTANIIMIFGMKQGDVKIKVLRENFIKKNQINPDYFTLQDQHDLESLQFCDDYLFHPKQTRVNLNKQLNLSPYKPSSHMKSLSIPTMTALVSDQKKSVQFKKVQQKIANTKNKQSKDPKIKIGLESNFIKVEKIKKRNNSANQAKVFPNFAVYIMKPCSVKPIKISPRPFSAFVNPKKQSVKSLREMKQRSVSQKVHRKKSILEPWQTDQNQF